MAIDTAAKRISAFNWGEDDALLPIPDGEISAEDRQHLSGGYVGIEAATSVVLGLAVRDFTEGELLRMQFASNLAMMDTCKIGAAGTPTGGEPGSRVPVDPDDYGSEISCGFKIASQTEPGDGSQDALMGPVVRLPIGTSITKGDRLKLTKRDGTALDTAEIYIILGVGARGRTALVLNCELVTGETIR